MRGLSDRFLRFDVGTEVFEGILSAVRVRYTSDFHAPEAGVNQKPSALYIVEYSCYTGRESARFPLPDVHQRAGVVELDFPHPEEEQLADPHPELGRDGDEGLVPRRNLPP